ncbi:hypothetical protein [Streptacidiphilus sp. P02-A3a]|uniref:hypothetical protein n=1 Tax=Streptacidiphilus sp. P02-A3a TaxID=2704468 RepID=UPI0015FCC361|nr:hypothetical protein [Streptacidiphilus sp. P02-A3a]QMU73325.1 hypothetical protein GXP74_38970 [Streptacidiphilus sp. P02-A3a]
MADARDADGRANAAGAQGPAESGEPSGTGPRSEEGPSASPEDPAAQGQGQGQTHGEGGGGPGRPGPRRPGNGNPDDDGQEQDEEGYSEFNRALTQVVNNHFHGPTNASGSVFGAGAAAGPGLSPGVIDQVEISRMLELYLEPSPYFEDALEKLTTSHIVALVGEDGIGRRAGAFALLRGVLGGRSGIRSLSPANSLAELAVSNTIKERYGYVILDYIGEVNTDAVQEFHMRRLGEELRKKHSFLVITASAGALRRQALKSFCSEWAAPTAAELFAHCVRRLPGRESDAELLAELGALVAEQRKPADVVAVARTLAEFGAEEGLRALRSGERALVAGWFADVPKAADVLLVAALAFAEGLPERTFEQALFRLVVLARNWEHTAAGVTVEAPVPALGDLRLDQTRASWGETLSKLVERRRIEQGNNGARAEKRIVFTSPRIRALVVEHLHELYGLELWYPLRQWLMQLSQQPDLEVRVQVAAGLALLACYAPVEVEENHLDLWSAGLSSQRVTAALTVQFMCSDPRSVPRALDLTLRWADRRGPERAVTAAMALAGDLGSLYRFEALNWLWFLTMRGQRIAGAARRSLHLLLANAERDPERAAVILRYVRTRLEQTRMTRERASALDSALALLDGPSLDGFRPVAAALLRHSPAAIGPLGRLWVCTLLSTRRRRALVALCATLAALRDDPAAVTAVRSLGGAMRQQMTPQQWNSLRHDLSRMLNHPDYAVDETRALARVLLGTLHSRPVLRPAL